jgi:mannose-6-phosphate isomerase
MINGGTKIDKPWGYELIWAHTDNYVGKRIHINAGKRLSKQYHAEKEESIYVISGILYVELEGERKRLIPGDHFDVPAGAVHRFWASEISVDLIEVSTSQLDDVVRIEDDFGRESLT